MTAERGAWSEEGRNLSAEGRAAERLRFLLEWAVLAPSRHNTQPWLFEIEGGELRIYADRTRALPAADPDGRQQLMSCGAALENLRLAAAHFGHATSVELLPGFRRDGLLGRVRLEERSASTPEIEELFRAIPRRRTNRLPLDGREPPDGLVTALLRDARSEGVMLRPVEPHQRRVVADVVAAADDAAWSSPRFRAEVAGWIRGNRSARRDGLPGYALGMGDAASVVHPLLVRLQNPARAEAERDRRRALGTKALLVLSTRRDGTREWVQAGVALQRILLRATAAGLYASYFAQPIESPELRRKLADAIGDPGAPQVMFRLGYGLEPRAVPRRPVEQVLRRIEHAAPRPAALALCSAPAPGPWTLAQPPVVTAMPAPEAPRPLELH
jgi:nitroreductase